MMKNKYFYVSHGKELIDYKSLIDRIKESKIVDNRTVLVNCNPDFSSYLCQLVNHKLSYMNGNELFEQLTLEIPSPNMSQVWNREEKEYQLYDTYIYEWIKKNIDIRNKYLFLSAFIDIDRPYQKLKTALSSFENSTFGIAYTSSESNFKPEFHVEQYTRELLFEWQNSNLNK